MANGQQAGGFFSAPSVEQARQSRRERLFSNFINTARSGGGGATLGAGIGTLITGLFGGQPGVDRATRIGQARQQIQQRFGGVQGLAQSDEAVRGAQQILSEAGLQREAQQLPFEVQQYRMNEAKMRPEPQERAVTIRGGTPQARVVAQRFGVNIPEGETYELKIAGGRVTDVNRLGSGQTINVGGQAGPGFKQWSEDQATRLSEMTEQGDMAVRNIAALDQAETALESFRTGAGGNVRQFIGQVGTLAGVPEEALGGLFAAKQSELFESASNTFTSSLVDQLPGQLSNKELDFLTNQAPSLVRTVEGNRTLINILKRGERRKLQRAQAVEDFVSKHQGFVAPDGTTVYDRLRQVDKQNPIITDGIRSEIRSGGTPIEAEPSMFERATGQLPEGVPEGSQRVGATQNGNPVYETPDGRRLVVE